jgi:two-component system, NtrC family, nitrogen regulation sensor histidine kinase NtrY
LKFKVTIPLATFLVCLLTGITAVYWAHQSTNPEAVADSLSRRLRKQLDIVASDAARVAEEQQQGRKRTDTQYPYYFFDNQKVTFWSDHSFVPTYASIAEPFKLKHLKAGNSDYLAVKFSQEHDRTLIFVIPLFRKYNITNDYLSPEWNEKIFPSGQFTILENSATSGIQVCVDGECPFRVSFDSQKILLHESSGIIAVVALLMALIILTYILFKYLKRLRYPEIGFLLLFVFLRGIRFVMIRLSFPTSLVSSDIFNPEKFASSTLNSSLGDLFLNELAVLTLCLFLFQTYQHLAIVKIQREKKWMGWMFGVVFGVGVCFAFLFPFVVLQTLFNNSTIVLDISQSLQFDIPRVIALASVLLACCCSFLFSHVFIRLLIGDNNSTRVWITFFSAIVVFAIINESTGQEYLSSLLLASGYFVTVYLLKFYSSLTRLGFTMFAYLFVCIFFLSLNSAYSIYHFGRKIKINNQFRFANDFLIDRDIFGEYLLQETATKIENDAFIQTRIASPFLNRDAIRQKIRQVFLPGYFNKYDVEIFLFAASGESLDSRSTITFPELVKTNPEAQRTNFPEVYFVNDPNGLVGQQYMVVVPVKRFGITSGYIVLALGLKRVIPESVYPELLVDNRAQQIYRSQNFSYAVFSKGAILYSAGDYNYEQQFDPDWLGNSAIHLEGLTIDDYIHIAEEDDSGRVSVVTTPVPSRTSALGNFSFLMVLGLTVILIFILIQGMVNYLRGDKLYFSARVQLYLNLAFFLPLIIVSISTLSLTNSFSQNQLNQEYLDKAQSFGEQLSLQLMEYIADRDENSISFENRLSDLAKLTNMDANVYDQDGSLRATSQPLIFENSLLSTFINPSALGKIRSGDNAFIRTESVGKLKYFVAYASLRKPSSGELMGIVGIPFFHSGISLEKVQVNIFLNILNIFTMIFIALLILSYFVSQWLTFPLKFITQTLRRTSLTKVNQPLVWKADDEIGLMVREYNQMLFKLSESKAELEQTQRERAWREIAQQVAHEIKNPLTPMKLTLQQMERAIQSGKNTEEKTGKAIGTLLTQVDTLNEIASSFSSFAKMPEPVIQRVELVTLVKRIVDLHSPEGDLNLLVNVREVYIMGDEQLLGRTFSNIILNAFQAAIPGKTNKVQVTLEKLSHTCRLSFEDHGKGIEPAIAERIFVPYFTTKKSGSGLGLAIAKQGIEHMQGKIWFETVVGSGTTFFIELPLA